MRIIPLIENSPGASGCIFEHGLSLYIETEQHRLLMDTGATSASMENAKQLGIDPASVDTVVLSHGHYDHTGGVLAFAAINPNAAIYLQCAASGAFYHGERYIGIDRAILSLPELRLVCGDVTIDEELRLFSSITGRRHWPQSNLELSYRDEAGVHHQDPFLHEQCLVIRAENQHILISGCAHNGILNILDRYREIDHADPDLVISGFHMMKKSAYTEEEKQTIINIAKELAGMNTVFYTGHCTGDAAFAIMKEIMGDKLKAIHTGLEIL